MDSHSQPSSELESIEICLQLFIKKILHMSAEIVLSLREELNNSHILVNAEMLLSTLDMVEQHSLQLKDLAYYLGDMDIFVFCKYPKLSGTLLTALLSSREAHMGLVKILDRNITVYADASRSISVFNTNKTTGNAVCLDHPDLNPVVVNYDFRVGAALAEPVLNESNRIIGESIMTIMQLVSALDTWHQPPADQPPAPADQPPADQPPADQPPAHRPHVQPANPLKRTASGYSNSKKSRYLKQLQQASNSMHISNSERTGTSESWGTLHSVDERSEVWENLSNPRAALKDHGTSVSSASERLDSEDGSTSGCLPNKTNKTRRLPLGFSPARLPDINLLAHMGLAFRGYGWLAVRGYDMDGNKVGGDGLFESDIWECGSSCVEIAGGAASPRSGITAASLGTGSKDGHCSMLDGHR